jgi:hypothetical protein
VPRVDEAAREVVRVHLAPVVVLVLEDLVADDPLLDLDVEEGRPAEDLTEEERRGVERLLRQGEGEDAEVGLRRGIQVPADSLERIVHRVRAGEPRRAAVDHVLEEVAQTVGRRGLVARAGAHVERDVNAVELRLRCDEDAQPVLEREVFKLERAETAQGPSSSSSSPGAGVPPSAVFAVPILAAR